MKKVNKESRIDDLMVDVVEYAFREWLVRRGIFIAFKANYEFTDPTCNSFREQLRLHIRFTLECPTLDLNSLVSSAFTFYSTPEGADFWKKQSDAWRRFCFNFRMQF